MLPPCPYRSGKHTLNTFKHRTFCLPGSFSCFASHTFLDFSLLPPALFNTGLVCLGLVWIIRMNSLCVLCQTDRTNDLEMSTVKKSYPVLFASDFKKQQNTVLLPSMLLREKGGSFADLHQVPFLSSESCRVCILEFHCITLPANTGKRDVHYKAFYTSFSGLLNMLTAPLGNNGIYKRHFHYKRNVLMLRIWPLLMPHADYRCGWGVWWMGWWRESNLNCAISYVCAMFCLTIVGHW